VASAGTTHRSGASRQAPSAARTGCGVSAAHSAIAVIDQAPVKTAAAAMARIATSGWRRPRPLRGSWIVEVGEQVRRFSWSQQVGVGELGEGGWDRG
jgi:hypothetical protein